MESRWNWRRPRGGMCMAPCRVRRAFSPPFFPFFHCFLLSGPCGWCRPRYLTNGPERISNIVDRRRPRDGLRAAAHSHVYLATLLGNENTEVRYATRESAATGQRRISLSQRPKFTSSNFPSGETQNHVVVGNTTPLAVRVNTWISLHSHNNRVICLLCLPSFTSCGTP